MPQYSIVIRFLDGRQLILGDLPVVKAQELVKAYANGAAPLWVLDDGWGAFQRNTIESVYIEALSANFNKEGT